MNALGVVFRILSFVKFYIGKVDKVLIQNFNTKVDTLNEKLAESNVYFWRHSRNNFNVRFLQDYVASDGIHVDRVKGMARYYSSLRGAVILGENALLRR